jgi:hypothetical protein
MGEVGVKEHSLGNGGFSSVYVSDNANVANALQCA